MVRSEQEFIGTFHFLTKESFSSNFWPIDSIHVSIKIPLIDPRFSPHYFMVFSWWKQATYDQLRTNCSKSLSSISLALSSLSSRQRLNSETTVDLCVPERSTANDKTKRTSTMRTMVKMMHIIIHRFFNFPNNAHASTVCFIGSRHSLGCSLHEIDAVR